MNPVYSFKCENGHQHNRPGKVGAEPPRDVHCPECGAACRRDYRAPGVKYMGTGWTGAQKARSSR